MIWKTPPRPVTGDLHASSSLTSGPASAVCSTPKCKSLTLRSKLSLKAVMVAE